MKFKTLLLIFFFVGTLLAENVAHYAWPKKANEWGTITNNIKSIPLKHWQLTGLSKEKDVDIPLLLKNVKEITFGTKVTLPKKRRVGEEVFLFTQNIHGACYFYANNHLLGLSPNSTNPLRFKIPADFFEQDSVLNLTLKIKRVESAEKGFPNIVYNLSEERFLGLGGMVYLQLVNPPTVTISQMNVVKKEIQFYLNYQYTIEANGPIKRLKVEENFFRSSTGKSLYKKIRYSQEIRGNTITLSGTFPLSNEDLWSPESPELLQFSVKGQLTTDSGTQTFSFGQTFGARKIKIEKQKFFLNANPLQIKGITLHFSPVVFNNGNYHADLKEMFEFLKQLNFNAIRLANTLPDAVVLNLADSLGLMVFAEFPIWRFPAEFFAENFLLESGKNICQQIKPYYQNHPSLAAVGLGQEIPLHLASTQKFMFILNSKLKTNLNVLTYISPIPAFPLPPERVSDFYLFDRYLPIHFLQPDAELRSFALIGKIGHLTPDLLKDKNNDELHQVNRSLLIKNEIFKALNDFQPNGGFVECLHDWFTEYPNDFDLSKQSQQKVPLGFLDENKKQKTWVKLLADPWQFDEATLLDQYSEQKPYTNFFSILMTLSTLLFFGIYRRVPRLRENVRRSLRHSYGFFVDLRERRIIPYFNSITVEIFISLVLAVFLSSQIYFFHKSLWLQEILAIFLIPLGVFKQYLQFSQNKLIITTFIFLLFMIIPFIGALILKILAWANRSKIRFRQGFATISWAAAPLIWFFPVSLVSYHYMLFQYPLQWLWIALAFFLLWTQIRLINGIHILFITKTSKVFFILLLCYFIPILIFWAIFNPPNYWVDYLQLMVNARSLF